MATKIITAIFEATCTLEELQNRFSENEGHKILLSLIMHKLRGVRTFLLCLKKLGTAKVTRFTYPNVEEGHESDHLETSVEEESQLESLLKRLECYLERIHTGVEYYRSIEVLLDLQTTEEEIDQWYTSLSDYLPLASNPLAANEVEGIFDSVLENVGDFLSHHIAAYVGVVVAPVEALKLIVTFWNYFLHFATFLGIDQQQEFQHFLRNMEALAFSAGHFTLHMFSAKHYNMHMFSLNALYGPDSHETSYDGIKSAVSALLVRINPLDNPHLHESYTRALVSMKRSRESYVPNLDMEEFSALLLSILWEALQFHTGLTLALKYKLRELYEGITCLRGLLKKHSNKFDGELGSITRSGIFDVGVIIFSVYQNQDSIVDGVEEFLGIIKVIQIEVGEQVVHTSKLKVQKTTVLAFLDFLLDYLTEVKSFNIVFVRRVRDDLIFLRSFMEKLAKLRNQLKADDLHEDVWNFAVEVAYKIELLIDQLVLGDILDSDLVSLESITKDMKIIKTDSDKIFDIVPLEVTWTDTADQIELVQSSIPSSDEIVGFEDEKVSIRNRLTGGSKKLQVIAIVGMPGLGKTTLATKVYNEPSVQRHFQVRAKCTFSQEFNKRKVLLELLNQILGSKSDEDYSKMTEDDLAHQLRRSLLQRRYLIFIDDVWEVEAFESFQLIFPGGFSGRILLTSRIGDVAKLDSAKPLLLRQLTLNESLELLQKKVSLGKDWPQPLYAIAVKIAKNCKGLPLLIIIVAGLLATTKQEVWEEVLGSLTSGIISSTDQCERTIDLSYKHLPEHLKPCLLSFGAFPEDEEISVKRLIWLWIAEGFVRKTDDSSILEEVAADYLEDLIGRSLVMNGQKRNGGGIKTCRIHDLLLDFCLRKSIEENALHLLNGKQKEVLPFEESRNLRRLCVHGKMDDFMESKLFCPRLHSLTFFGEEEWSREIDMSIIFRIFKLLRVLNMQRVRMSSYDFPGEIGNLVWLRYLEITVFHAISPSIGNLRFLETLILDTDYTLIEYELLFEMPDTFWNLQNLRHLYFDFNGIVVPIDEVDSCSDMLKLDSVSGIYSEHWSVMENILRKFPIIRRLKFCLKEFGNGSKVMSFSFLSRLESLSLSFHENYTEFEFIFPESLKKLHLTNGRLSWEKISRIAKLPNLDVLKLDYGCFIGDRWQMEEGEFPKLRFLKLEGLEIISWTGCDDQFPNLEKLVVEGCDALEEIPECLESLATLERIEVTYCSDHVECLFETLADCLKDRGNSELQVHVRSTSEHADDEEEDSANVEVEEDSESEYYKLFTMKHSLELTLGLPGQGSSPRKKFKITEQQQSLILQDYHVEKQNEEAPVLISEAASLFWVPRMVDVSFKNKPTRSSEQRDIEFELQKEENKRLKEENVRLHLQAWKSLMGAGGK